MHVAISGWLVDSAPSGAKRRLLGLLRATVPLLSADERITVLHGPSLQPEALGPACTWRRIDIPAAPTWRRALRERRILRRTLVGIGATVVDLGALPTPPNLPCPTVLTIHDLRDLDGWRRGLRPAAFARMVLRRSTARADELIVPSNFTAERLRVHLTDLPPINVIEGGIEAKSIRRGSRSEPPFLLHVGHLEPRKNLGLLITVLADLAPTHPTLTLVFAGADHGSQTALTSQARQLGIERRVKFAGVVSEVELETLYSAAAAVVIPSRYEGFGLPALEALAAGRPTFVANSSALPDVVGNAACTLPDSDANAWTAAIEAALASDSEDAATARLQRAQSMTWDMLAPRSLEIWRRLSAPPRGSSGDSKDQGFVVE